MWKCLRRYFISYFFDILKYVFLIAGAYTPRNTKENFTDVIDIFFILIYSFCQTKKNGLKQVDVISSLVASDWPATFLPILCSIV